LIHRVTLEAKRKNGYPGDVEEEVICKFLVERLQIAGNSPGYRGIYLFHSFMSIEKSWESLENVTVLELRWGRETGGRGRMEGKGREGKGGGSKM